MHDKNFDEWSLLKKELNHDEAKKLFQEGEIWMTHVGVNIGIEQDGKGHSFCRPVLVLRKYNMHHFVGIPLSSREKIEKISFLLQNISFLKPKSWLVLSQIRIFDSRRLHRKLGKLSDTVFENIHKKSARVIMTRASGA